MSVYNKVFFHGVGTGIGQMVQELTSHGIPITAKAVAEGGWAESVATMSRNSGVRHNIIYRDPEPGDHPNDHPNYNLSSTEAAAEHWKLVLNSLPQEVVENRDMIWIEPVNEIDTGVWGKWLGEFCYTVGTLAIRDGYKVLLSGFNAGQPDLGQWEIDFGDFLRLCANNPDSVGVSIHESKLGVPMDTHPEDPRINPWVVGRWKFLHDACDNLSIARPTIFISEWAWAYNNMPSEEVAMRDIAWISESIASHPNIRGVLLWNLDTNPNWGELPGKLVKLIPWLTQFTIDTRYQDVPRQESPIFYSPVGFDLSVRSSKDSPYPEHWENVNGYKNLYVNSSTGNQSYHTGDDMNLNVPSWDTDRGMGVFPAANGTVVHVGMYPVWGTIVIIEHDYRGAKVYTRYGHLHRVPVTIGQYVLVNDKIGVIGNDALNGPYHLHFDISLTDVLLRDPADWPGMDIDRVSADYVDPSLFMMTSRSVKDIPMPAKIKHTIHLFPQDTTVEELVSTVTELHATRSAFTYSHDVAHAVMYAGNKDSKVVLWNPERWAEDIVSYFEDMGVNIEIKYFLHEELPVPPVSPPPTGNRIDMAKYFIPMPGVGNFGHIVILANSWSGGNERQQLQRTAYGDLLTKNSQYEHRAIGMDYIDLVMDTSPGDGEYYTSTGHWIPRLWTPGGTYISGTKDIVFYKKDCSPVPGKAYTQQPTTLRFAEHYDSWATKSGISFDDVAKLEWIIDGKVDETYWFAKGMGLIAWQKYDGRESHAVEVIQPGQQDNNIPDIIHCAGV